LMVKAEDMSNNISFSTPVSVLVDNSNSYPQRLNIKRPKKFEAFLLISKRIKSNKNFFYLSKNKNLKEVAKNLYKTLRKVKKKGFKQISIERIPNRGIGEAINDRLLRAAVKK